jgi:hypothetical protein
MDSAKRLHGIVDRAEERIERITGGAEKLIPPHSRKAERMTPEERKEDYLLALNTPGGLQQRLREYKQQYPAKIAYEMFIEWDIENG